MPETFPTGEPPTITWLSFTSWPAFENTNVYLCPPPPLKRTMASTITTTARAAIAAMRAGVIPRLGAERFSSPWGFTATGRRLPLLRPPRPCGTGARIVSEAFPAKRRRSGDLTGNQRATLAAADWLGEMGGAPHISDSG